jgi:glutathione peroxidase
MNAIQDIKFNRPDGKTATLSEFKGKVVMIVNVASKCGLTPQYEALEKLYRKYAEKGFTILGFPANNFLAQEPGSDDEIQEFCKLTYDVTFPVMSKISVKGEDKHPLYTALMNLKPMAMQIEGSTLAEKLEKHGQRPESDSGILWNFEKFLIDKEGNVAARFAPDMAPDSSEITETINKLL